MTLDEFLSRLHDDLASFSALWRREHARQPDLWPMELEGPEWHEQFLVHMEGGLDDPSGNDEQERPEEQPREAG